MRNEKAVNIIVIGSGMYVCGRGTGGYGTIIPAVCEWSKKNPVGIVRVVGTDPKGAALAEKKIAALMQDTGTGINVACLPSGRAKDKMAYKKALADMPKPCVCIVAVPDELHTEVAKEAIAAGCHTLVVKPLAPTLKEVKELVRLAGVNGIYGAVEYHKRLDNVNMLLKDTITKGDLGDPLYILVEYSQRKSIPAAHFKKWVTSTNIFQYLGIHYVDMIYYVTAAAPLRAMAVGQKGYLRSKGIDAYDAIQAVIEWKMPSGTKFTSCIFTNWIDPESTSAMSDQKIKVIGTKGRIESDQKSRGITIITDEKGIEEPNPYFSAAYGSKGRVEYRGYGIDSIMQFLDDAAAVEKGAVKVGDLEKARPTFRQSIVPTKVLEAVNKSLKNKGEWFEID